MVEHLLHLISVVINVKIIIFGCRFSTHTQE
jgi:hypothetical protein